MSHITITLLKEMWVGVSIFLLLVFFLNKMTIFRKTLTTSNPTWRHKILFILVFSFIGLCGLYWNIPMDGGLINFRSVGPIVGGIIGGPVVGTISGMIVGGCRVLVYNTTANEIHGIITVMQGIIAGLLSKTIKSRPHMWLHSFICTALIEYGAVLFLFSMFHPSMDEREYILETIFPIVVTNSIAVSLFMGVLEDSVQLAQRSSSFAAKTTFTSVNLMLQTIHTGLTAVNLQQISDIIIRSLPDVAAISLSAGKERVQTVTANAEDPAFIQKSFALAHESQSIHPKRYIWFSKIDYHEHLSAEMIVIKRKGNPFTQFEINFLEGMQELIKTIVQFNHLKKEEELLKESEIRMLQAQINPHFLFNTLNTINYYCMADPETAMDLIGYLSDYYRYSLSNPRSLVPISEELEDIQVYVNLESARFADRLHVEYRFPKHIQFKIPPLLL